MAPGCSHTLLSPTVHCYATLHFPLLYKAMRGEALLFGTFTLSFPLPCKHPKKAIMPGGDPPPSPHLRAPPIGRCAMLGFLLPPGCSWLHGAGSAGVICSFASTPPPFYALPPPFPPLPAEPPVAVLRGWRALM